MRENFWQCSKENTIMRETLSNVPHKKEIMREDRRQSFIDEENRENITNTLHRKYYYRGKRSS